MSARTLVNPNNTPRELWSLQQWVCWRYVDRGRPKPDKCPVNPHTLGNAGATWPNTWSTIRHAVATYQEHPELAGIGFVLTEAAGVTMIDLDNCLIGDQPSPFAQDVLEALPTYTERSPSGRGLRLLLRCNNPPANVKRETIELYSHGRFTTLTGNVLTRRPLATVGSLEGFIRRFVGEKKHDPPFFLSPRCEPTADDAELLQQIFAHNRLAAQLYDGDLSAAHGDYSRAVILLANSLALWTKGDAARMRRMMESSGLKSDKFEKRVGRGSWLEHQIADAINFMGGQS